MKPTQRELFLQAQNILTSRARHLVPSFLEEYAYHPAFEMVRPLLNPQAEDRWLSVGLRRQHFIWYWSRMAYVLKRRRAGYLSFEPLKQTELRGQRLSTTLLGSTKELSPPRRPVTSLRRADRPEVIIEKAEIRVVSWEEQILDMCTEEHTQTNTDRHWNGKIYLFHGGG